MALSASFYQCYHWRQPCHRGWLKLLAALQRASPMPILPHRHETGNGYQRSKGSRVILFPMAFESLMQSGAIGAFLSGVSSGETWVFFVTNGSTASRSCPLGGAPPLLLLGSNLNYCSPSLLLRPHCNPPLLHSPTEMVHTVSGRLSIGHEASWGHGVERIMPALVTEHRRVCRIKLRVPLLAASCIVTSVPVFGKVYHGIDELPATLPEFDFIVAGGGTAGCVLASRLSESKQFKVLVVEAGPEYVHKSDMVISLLGTKLTSPLTRSNTGILNITVPAYTPVGHVRWNFTSEPMPGLNGRTLPVSRGHVLGGSSSVNAMVYTRGSADDYDNWGRVTGDRRWSWEGLWPYILRSERWTAPAGGRNATGQYDPSVHGYDGKVMTSLPWSGPDEADKRALRNTELQPEFPFVKDLNSGSPIGLSFVQSTIGNGERSSAATAYLPPQVRERPNLTILLNTYITRVCATSRTGLQPDIRTLEIAPRAGGERITITASKELILSGGVIGSAHILLNSGVGNITELTALGIPSLLGAPDVGRNLMEHVAVPMTWRTVPHNITSIPQDVAWEMWTKNRTGPLTQRAGHQFLFARLPANSTLFQTYEDPSTGPRTPHLQAGLTAVGNQSFGSQIFGLMTPYSRGSLKLRSNNPFDDPIIDLNLLSHPFDLAALREGARLMKRWYSGPAWEGYITGLAGPDPDTLSEEEFEKAVRDTAVTFVHPHGTVQMASRASRRGVVDGELRVKGATGLRVVDGSVFPFIPSANSQAAVYILAERASDLIRDAW
ncbi:hypothetical protein NMY22_g16273 [Coprinellus aureogranulatus]|nr:hypothetical protein NMY22_g16273 [Coprinellus aureogranulatus]